MKKYIAPELNIESFSVENILQLSEGVNETVQEYLSRMGFSDSEMDEFGFEDLQ